MRILIEEMSQFGFGPTGRELDKAAIAANVDHAKRAVLLALLMYLPPSPMGYHGEVVLQMDDRVGLWFCQDTQTSGGSLLRKKLGELDWEALEAAPDPCQLVGHAIKTNAHKAWQESKIKSAMLDRHASFLASLIVGTKQSSLLFEYLAVSPVRP